MKVRFVIKEEVVQPADVKTKEDIESEITAMLPELDGNQLAALQKYAMELQNPVTEADKLTKKDMKKREKYVKGMKSSKKDFEKRYGKDAEDVMYATATKMAMKKK